METLDPDVLGLDVLGLDVLGPYSVLPPPDLAAVNAAAPGGPALADGAPDVPLLLRPFVWLLALAVLPLRAAGRAGERFLEGYERGADAAGRAVLRGCRAVGRALVRVLGPLGRWLHRLLSPAWRLLVRAWDRTQVWLMTVLFRPLGQLSRWVLGRFRPAVERALGWGRAVVSRLEPVYVVVGRAAMAVDRAADRLGTRVRRAWAPVQHAVGRLRRNRDARDD